jgi:hypothetical protein
MRGLTIDEASRELARALELLGGDAPLVMADCMPVRFKVSRTHGCVFVSDLDADGQELELPSSAQAG